MKREIKFIVVHCTDTAPKTSLKEILPHLLQNKLKTPPYHIVIQRDGSMIRLSSTNTITGGSTRFDEEALHIAWLGGKDKLGNAKKNITVAQQCTLFELVMDLLAKHAKADIVGLKDITLEKIKNPNFDVKSWFLNFPSDVLYS